MKTSRLTCRPTRIWICLISLAALGAIASADVRIDAAALDQLPPGSVRHPSVQAVSADAGEGISFVEGGLTLPTEGHLTAATGTVEIWFRVPQPWRSRRGRRDAPTRTLLHLTGEAGRIDLFAQGGSLTAIYKTGEKSAMIRYRGGRWWEADSSHTVELAWYRYGAGIILVLRADGELVGVAEGAAMDLFPAQVDIGVQADTHPFGGVIESIALKAQATPEPTLQPGSWTIRVQAGEQAGTVYDFWRIQNTPLCYRAVDPAWIATRAGKAPFSKEINCVYLLGGRWPGENMWFKGVKDDGTIEADFTGMIAQLKALIDAGYVPHIVLDNVPNAMSDPPQENFYGNTAPPADEKVWHAYVQQAIRAMVKAFGRETVGGWWFRVGTEPDLKPAHWAGTREEYLAHYDYTVDAVASVVPEAKIGPGNILNPSRSMTRADGPWGLDIIDHAATGTNAVTGDVGTRMDFFSCSWYGGVGRSISDFDAAVEAIHRRLRRYPKLADLPIHIGEHSVLNDEYGRRLWAGDTTEWGASFYAAFADRVYAQGIEQVYEWDHATSGVMHPKGHVIWMLRQMLDGSRLPVAVDGTSAARCGAIAGSKDGRIFVLAYNHRSARGPKVDETVRLEIHDPRMKAGSTWRVSEWTIDAERASWAYAYEADLQAAGLEPVGRAGRYEGALNRYYGEEGAKLFRANIAKYRKLAQLPRTKDGETVTVQDGGCSPHGPDRNVDGIHYRRVAA